MGKPLSITWLLALMVLALTACGQTGQAAGGTDQSSLGAGPSPSPQLPTPSPSTTPTPSPTTTPSPSTTPTPRPSSGANITVPSKNNSALGVDVSDYQGTINWATVVASGKTFAYIKATEGLTIDDTQFANSWKSRDIIAMGAYHYFHPDDDGVLQAQHFLSVVGTMTPGQVLPPMVDVETFDGQSAATVISQLQAFISTVEAATGMVPVIYTDLEATWNALGNPQQFIGYPLVIAYPDASEPLVPPPWSVWLGWQYSWTGTVPGITGATDLDMFYGTENQLQTYLQTGVTPN